MKKIYPILVLAVAAVFSSCEKVVELKVVDGDPILVINSQISNQTEKWVVNLSSTQGYFDQNDITYVENALVTISDNEGNIDTLRYNSEGNFETNSVKNCKVGNTYTLAVTYKNETYYASETCDYQDTITFIKSYFLPEQNGFIPSGWYVFEKAEEFLPDGDFYMWKLYQNDTSLVDDIGYQLDTDEFRETGYWNLNIDPDNPLKDTDRGVFPRPFPYKFEVGDTVRVEQYRISEGYFNFLAEFSNQQNRAGTPFDPPPSNPKTNISNGGYGYFSVVNVDKKSIVIEE